MTPEEREALYDAEIAPALAALSKKCQDAGMSFLAEVEWDPSEAAGGMTVALCEGSSFAFRLMKLAGDARGNVDGMIMALLKSDAAPGNSLYLRICKRG